jgi:retron-type reverse transcriptase
VKRYGNLWERVLDWPNLLRAARLARRGKRHRYAVQRFQFRAEWELLRLREELRAGTYEPGPFATHTITRPKPRLISAAPYRDRVVHHALMGVLEPIFDAHFHEHSFACRKGKGTHAAADRLQRLLARNRYLIACDVQKFFPSIDHEILKGLLRRRIKDRNVLALADLLIDRSNEQDGPAFYFPGDNLFTPYERRRGLPIGNLTSQWFANLYLDGLDHFITSRLGFGAYVRYCDDFVILGNDRAALRDAFARIVEYTNGLRLKLHDARAHVRNSTQGATFVGFRIWSTHRFLRKDNVRAFRRRVRWMRGAFERGALTLFDVRQRFAAWIAHAANANSHNLIARALEELQWFLRLAEAQNR